MKLLIGIAIVCFSTYCGRFFSKKYLRRKRFFGQIYDFNERYLNEMSYYRRPLSAFLQKYSYQGEFSALLACFFEDLSQKTTKKTAMNDCLSAYDFLTGDEKSLIGDYFQMVGKGDSLSQKEYFSSVRTSLLKLRDQTAEEGEKYGKLYLKLGFLCGLTLLIIIV